MTRIKRLPSALLLSGALALTACGSDSASVNPAATTQSGPAHNEADTAFTQQMMAHHTQAIEMAYLAGVATTTKKVRAIADVISKDQQGEIDLMSGWLDEWNEHHQSEGHGHGPGEAPDGTLGMMSADAMTELAALRGEAFDVMWLNMMIEHHEGAITMARDEAAKGQFKPAKTLAATIVADQTREIAVLRSALADTR
jgi:uncharacterized protein (DUF305 family)